MTEESWTPGDVAGVIANPFTAITFDPDLFGEHDLLVDEDTWIQANIQLVEELGPEAYLRNLLVILKTGGAKGPDGGPFGYQTGTTDGGPSRNQPCPCGSGRKYKHCHGKRG